MRDLLTTAGELAGIALVTVGLWWIYPPAALIFAGVAVGFISFWQVKR